MDERRRRIHEAGREGLRNRLLEEWRLPMGDVDEVLLAWEVEAAARGLSPGDFGFWRQAPDWVMERRR